VQGKNRWLVLLLAVSVAAATGPPAGAWNDRGHMTVAYVAYQRLRPATRQRVDQLLKLNPRYGDWASRVDREIPGGSAEDRNLMIFMIAATWADAIKRDPGYQADGSQGGNRPEGSPDAGANSGYADRLMHKYWHFVDTPFAPDGTPLPAVPAPNVGERIRMFREVLASPGPDELKSYDLTWLLHLVGDVHQPLHAATRVSSALPAGDAGGNLVKLDCARCELHFFWDDLLGSDSDLTSVLAGAQKLPRAKAALARKSDEAEWITESFREAQRTVYSAPVGAGNGPFTLSAAYQKKALALARERVALAGARLANLLNTELH